MEKKVEKKVETKHGEERRWVSTKKLVYGKIGDDWGLSQMANLGLITHLVEERAFVSVEAVAASGV